VFISLKVLEMNKKTLVILCLVFVFGAVFTVLAQNPTETPRNVPASAIDDSAGGGRYLVGPGDILDVRVFGNGDLNSTVEVDADGNISSLHLSKRRFGQSAVTKKRFRRVSPKLTQSICSSRA
jgi:hypothetical protein